MEKVLGTTWEILVNLVRWGIFSVGIGLAPLLVFHIENGGPFDSLNSFVQAFTSDGEILILATALVGEGLSDILNMQKSPRLVQIVAGGGAVLVIIGACLLVDNLKDVAEPDHLIITIAQNLFWAALIISAGTKIALVWVEETVKYTISDPKDGSDSER